MYRNQNANTKVEKMKRYMYHCKNKQKWVCKHYGNNHE